MRQAASALLGADMWSQWGSRDATDEEWREHEAAVAGFRADHAAAAEGLAALVTALRASSPESVEAWAEAHRQLLDAFIAECGDDEAQATAVFVAREEWDGWGRVRDGEIPYVDENSFYVAVDRDQYRAVFGIDF